MATLQAVGQPHFVHLGDRRLPFSDILLDRGGGAIDLAALTVKLAVDDFEGTNVISATATGVTIQPTADIIADPIKNEWFAENHGLRTGDEVVLATSGVLPAGFTVGTRYFVRDVSVHRFRLSYKPSVTAITVADGGTMSHTFYAVGHVVRAWQAGELPDETNDAEDHRAYWIVEDGGSLVSTHPYNGYRPVRVIPAP